MVFEEKYLIIFHTQLFIPFSTTPFTATPFSSTLFYFKTDEFRSSK